MVNTCSQQCGIRAVGLRVVWLHQQKCWPRLSTCSARMSLTEPLLVCLQWNRSHMITLFQGKVLFPRKYHLCTPSWEIMMTWNRGSWRFHASSGHVISILAVPLASRGSMQLSSHCFPTCHFPPFCLLAFCFPDLLCMLIYSDNNHIHCDHTVGAERYELVGIINSTKKVNTEQLWISYLSFLFILYIPWHACFGS